MKHDYHIIDLKDKYVVVECFEINDQVYSRILPEAFYVLDNATEYVRMITEDAVPANAMAAGPGASNISTYSPILRFIKRRKNKEMLKLK